MSDPWRVLKVYADRSTFDGLPIKLEDFPDIFKKWKPSMVELYGDYFTDAMTEAVRLALQYRIEVHGNSPQTVYGMDQVVTGGLQSVN